MIATYAKLRSGEWGVRVVSDRKPSSGDVVIVRERSGVNRTEMIERVIWTGQGVALCTLRRPQNGASRSSARGRRART